MKKDARNLPHPPTEDGKLTGLENYRKNPEQVFDESFEAVFLRNWPGVCTHLTRIVGDAQQAEDLAMQVFWKLYRYPPKEQANLSGWLYRVATNFGLNALRSNKRRSHYEELAGRANLENENKADPAKELERVEQRQQVRRVLAAMKPRSARLLLLRHAGLTYSELAATLKINKSSIGKLLARAEDEFERLYRRTYPDGDECA